MARQPCSDDLWLTTLLCCVGLSYEECIFKNGNEVPRCSNSWIVVADKRLEDSLLVLIM